MGLLPADPAELSMPRNRGEQEDSISETSLLMIFFLLPLLVASQASREYFSSYVLVLPETPAQLTLRVDTNFIFSPSRSYTTLIIALNQQRALSAAPQSHSLCFHKCSVFAEHMPAFSPFSTVN